MMVRILTAAASAAFIVTSGIAAQAAGLSQKECSEKFQAAKTANTLNGMKYPAFRKAQCGDAPTTETTTQPPAKPETAAKPAAAPGAAPAATTAVFPKAIDPKYSSDKPGTARRKTCTDQYDANKSANANANGGMKWIEKGGGYWSACNKHLKGTARGPNVSPADR